MTSVYKELAERIQNEVADLDRIVQRITQTWARTQRVSSDQDVYVDSVALNLHGFYSGLERLFELTARHVDRALPDSATWHRDLLDQMAHDLPDVRPAIIDQSDAVALDEFRRFRHLVRNVYTINLMPNRMQGIVSILPELWPKLRAELLAFADFLEQLADKIS